MSIAPAPSVHATRLASLVQSLRAIVGRKYLLTKPTKTRSFSTGFRHGEGPVLAVIRPGSLVELWRTVRVCTDAGVIVIMQSANTGLTGGSTPNGQYDRDVVLINTLRIKGIHVIEEGRQVICLPGSTLYELETRLRPLGREPHSVIGSSCIGASVLGGVCNNSGGSLVQRGPAYTELALYARLDEQGHLQLVNHLGLKLGHDPEDMLHRLETGSFGPTDIETSDERRASDQNYCGHVRQVDANTPARFNADPARLFEASGSAGRVILFAARLDTFAQEAESRTFYIGTNSVADLTAIRRDILQTFEVLPVSGEYVHRDAFDIAAIYGKDTVVAIERLGTDRLPRLFALKAWVDGIARKVRLLPPYLSDRLMQAAGYLFRDHLPPSMRAYRDRYEHHLILKMGGGGIDEARRYLRARYPSMDGDFFECTDAEGAKAFLHRFAVAGAAMRYRSIHNRDVGEIIALDIALRRNDDDWFENLPDRLDSQIVRKLYYGHFFCHVFHHDYIVEKGADPAALKRELLAVLDQRGAEYPAEHNVGHLYKAKPALVGHYRALDPCNSFNPGVGDTPRGRQWL